MRRRAVAARLEVCREPRQEGVTAAAAGTAAAAAAAAQQHAPRAASAASAAAATAAAPKQHPLAAAVAAALAAGVEVRAQHAQHGRAFRVGDVVKLVVDVVKLRHGPGAAERVAGGVRVALEAGRRLVREEEIEVVEVRAEGVGALAGGAV